MIDFKCPRCGETLSVPSSLTGQIETCPSCGQMQCVPPASQVDAPPALPPHVEQEERECPLCGRKMDNHEQMYGHLVCRKCSFAFAFRRHLAFAIDFMALGVALTFVASEPGIPSLFYWLLLGAFCCKDGLAGRSPGKMLCGVRVTHRITGRPVWIIGSFLRNLPLVVLFVLLPLLALAVIPTLVAVVLPENSLLSLAVIVILLFCLIPFMPAFVGRELRYGYRTGDHWASTKVIFSKYADNPVFAPETPGTKPKGKAHDDRRTP